MVLCFSITITGLQMIQITNTKEMTGVHISGTWDDLSQLVDAFHTITIDEFSEDPRMSRYIDMSTRVLGLCYDVRHASQGDREVEMVENGMDRELMEYHQIVTPLENVHFACDYLYPELLYCMIALNILIDLRSGGGRSQGKRPNKQVIWDPTIAVIRNFQAQAAACLQDTLTPASYTRMLGYLNNPACRLYDMLGQYLDVLNIEYLAMDREKRLKNLNRTAKRISQYANDPFYISISRSIRSAAREYNCGTEEIKLVAYEYPEEIIW